MMMIRQEMGIKDLCNQPLSADHLMKVNQSFDQPKAKLDQIYTAARQVVKISFLPINYIHTNSPLMQQDRYTNTKNCNSTLSQLHETRSQHTH